MEADRSLGGRIRRKPLADCTNTVVSRFRRPSSSSFSVTDVKSANPSLASSLNRIIDNTTNRSSFVPGSVSRGQVTAVANPSSADPASPTTTPSHSRNSRSVRDIGHKEIVEPHSVYTRRKDSVKRKSKEITALDPVDCPLTNTVFRSRGKTHRADENTSKPLTTAREKRQRQGKRNRDGARQTLPQEFIEQQRAYFAEIDAFELPEEEVTSTSDLE
ncbi:PREDICTED: LOW QUALITY PROTEIN: uncharacterized protein LOC104824352 [Tarenaya hassleriana]|uniref:LOW QUALITY PROTEIN: uncharacterized protein LOC104824352 n=1 Tax=Tarenaya hassleriana TaxID=28532 RepID=UPI00053C688A|nr:PREDICTED: LOW QUALITY PROTEIN: uncharacterized protein LOC104824352 [Tarenaya hassleriana]